MISFINKQKWRLIGVGSHKLDFFMFEFFIFPQEETQQYDCSFLPFLSKDQKTIEGLH